MSDFGAIIIFKKKSGSFSSDDKKKIEKLPYSIRSACWFWSESRKLNEYADLDDLIYITYRVNGGFNHYDKRLIIYNKTSQQLCKKSGIKFNIEESKCFSIIKACFAWGLWHDPSFPSSKFKGVERDATEAIVGYKQFLILYNSAEKPKSEMYGYSGTQAEQFAIQRIKALSK